MLATNVLRSSVLGNGWVGTISVVLWNNSKNKQSESLCLALAKNFDRGWSNLVHRDIQVSVGKFISAF